MCVVHDFITPSDVAYTAALHSPLVSTGAPPPLPPPPWCAPLTPLPPPWCAPLTPLPYPWCAPHPPIPTHGVPPSERHLFPAQFYLQQSESVDFGQFYSQSWRLMRPAHQYSRRQKSKQAPPTPLFTPPTTPLPPSQVRRPFPGRGVN